MHVRAARRNGLTDEEIGEVLLQCAVYCGVPAANSAFQVFRACSRNEDRRSASSAPARRASRWRGCSSGPGSSPSCSRAARATTVEHRVRAGVLEQRTADLLRELGVGERMDREGIVHHGIHLQFDGERHRVPLSELAGGRTIVIYGQTEVVKDLIAARLDSGLPLPSSAPSSRASTPSAASCATRGGELECDVIAGCDGFHGVCRGSIPDGVLRTFEREYPFGWLGILAQVAPSMDELVYAHHERGFALLSLRSPQLSRYYVQVAHDEDVAAWPDERIWEELQRRTALDGLDAARGADPREGRHRDAELRRRADAARQALPRRRRGAHRAADGREGTEPRDRGRARARGGDRGTAALER